MRRLPILYFPFEFPMMLAQTGIESVSSTAATPAESASTAFWWLVLLAIACLALTWYLRRLNNAKSETSGRKDSQKRPSPKAKTAEPVLPNELETPRDSDTNRQFKASKSSSKKKKKSQSKGQQNSKKLERKQDAPKVEMSRVPEATISSEKTPGAAKSDEISMESASTSLSPATASTPVPVAAIFEPLRKVVPPRRKRSSLDVATEGKTSPSVNEESVNRPASGGKFERMVPSTTFNRAAASRWPASMTTPVERSIQARPAEAKLESKPVGSGPALQTTALPHPAIPAAKGLKSFVSKVKSATSSDSAMAESVPEERNATEGVQ